MEPEVIIAGTKPRRGLIIRAEGEALVLRLPLFINFRWACWENRWRPGAGWVRAAGSLESLAAVVLREGGGRGWGTLVRNKSPQSKTGNALTADSDRCTAVHRARKSSGPARLFKSFCILGGLKQGSSGVNTGKLCVGLIACQNLASPLHTWNTNDEEKPFSSARCAAVALAADPSSPGSGTVRLYCPPLTSPPLANLPWPDLLRRVIPPPLHLHPIRHVIWPEVSRYLYVTI